MLQVDLERALELIGKKDKKSAALRTLGNHPETGEPTAVDHTFSSFGGLFGTIKAMVFSTYASPKAERRLAEESEKPHGPMAMLGLTVEGKPSAATKSGEREKVAV